MLRPQDLDQLPVRAARLQHFREDVDLFQHMLMVILAEVAEELGGIHKRGGVDIILVRFEAAGEFRIDVERAPKHAVLAHQIFGCGNVFVLFSPS